MIKNGKDMLKNIVRHLGFEISRFDPVTLPELNAHHLKRLIYFNKIFDLVKNVEGDVVECGVWKGYSLLAFSLLTFFQGKERNIWGFDSFEGFPELTKEDKSIRNLKKGDYADTSIEYVREILQRGGLNQNYINNHIKLVKGYFENTLNQYTGSRIAVLHLDVDLYKSYKTTLKKFAPMVAKGGVILFDEYKEERDLKHYPGASKAIDEYLGPLSRDIIKDEISNKYYYVKNQELPNQSTGAL